MPPYYANRRDGYRLRVALWKEVLEAAGFPFNRFDYGRKILASAQYSERQKAVALLLADVPGVDPIEYPLHMRAWVQRQFLGLDPPGLLFDVVGEETLFDFFRVLAVKNKPAALGWVSSLPIGRRLEVIGELMLAGDCSDYDLSLLLAPLWPELKDEGRSWAPVYADRLLTFFEDARGGEIHTSFGPRLRGDLAITVLLALVRAEIPIEPRWDTLFEMCLVNVETVPWEIVEALPEVRRPLAVRRIAEGGDRNYLRRWGGPLVTVHALSSSRCARTDESARTV